MSGLGWKRCVAAFMLPIGLLATVALNANAQPAAGGTPQLPATSPVTAQPAPPQSEIFPGNGSFLGQPRRRQVAQTSVDSEDGITLNFVNADIKDVAKAVLGDYLKLNYEIGANVIGTVTIQTSRALPRAQVLSVLDQTLRLSGMAVVVANDIYKVVPAADAPRQSGPVIRPGARGADSIGYGFEIAPVKYIGAAEMAKLLEPLAPTKAVIHVDATRNVLIIEGTEQERQTLLDDIALFDADWLSGMSFALFTPTNLDSSQLAKELTQVLGGMNSPILDVVRLVPIDRLNTVLAISSQKSYLQQLQTWVARLDKPGTGSDRQVFVYNVQFGRSTDLAETLGRALFGSDKGASATAPGREVRDTNASPASNAAPVEPREAIGGGQNAPSAAAQFSGALEAGGSGPQPVTFTADSANNALVIVSTPQQYTTIKAALALLDVPPLQVFLEAAIAEVTLNDNLQYGVQYFFQPNSTYQAVLSNSATTSILPSLPGLAAIYAGSNIKITLDALSAVTHVEILSSPQIMVLNNQTATLQVGDQVPIITQQAVSTVTTGAPLVNSVQYQGTGVILKVTPRVNRNGQVMMDVTQEVSNVTATTTSAINSPTIQQRKITTAVAVQNGETVALGGLITKSSTTTKNGIPLLAQIPVLGALFRDTGTTAGKTELIVLITPHVVENVEQARSITEELRRKLPSLAPLLEK